MVNLEMRIMQRQRRTKIMPISTMSRYTHNHISKILPQQFEHLTWPLSFQHSGERVANLHYEYSG